MKTKQWFERLTGGHKSLSLGVAVASMMLGGQVWATPASTSTWYGTVSTDWNNATNWTPSWQIPSSIQPVPTSSSTANISSGCSFYPVIKTSVSVGSVAIIQGSGSVTVTNGGSLNVGSGGVQVSGGAALAIPAGSVTTLGAVTLGGNILVTNGGSLTIGSGGMAASSSSTFNIASGSSLVSTGAVTIGGNFTLSGTMTAPVQVYSTATFTVNTNGVLNTSVGGWNVNSGGGTVNVYGTVNDGTNTVNVNTTLNLSGGTLVAGPILISQANVTLTSATLTCAGITLYNDANLNVSGASTVNSTAPWNFYGGQTTISGSTFNFSGGTQTIPSGSYSNLNLSGGGTLTLSGGSVSGNFSIATNTVAGLTSGLNIPVGSLTLASAGEPSGTWGSTNSTAVNKNSTFFTGTGLLTVSNNTSIKSTTTTLAALTTVNYGNNVVLSATVSPTPTGGNIQFQTNGVTLGSPVALSAGTASLTTSLAAGSYTVTAVYSGTNGYSASTSAAATQTVNPVAVTIASGLTANGKVYNGTTAATISSNNVVLNGVIAADSAKVALSTNGYTATFVSPYMGTKNVSVQGLVLTGTAAGNYTLTQPTLSATITAAPLTLTGVTAANTNYNGTTVALLSGGSLSGVVNGDSVTFTTGTGSFASKYVGTWAVTASGYALATSGVATNYTLTAQPTVPNATITPAPLTFVSGITANSKVYDGTTTATITSNNVVLNGVVAGDTVYITTNGYSAAFASANMGTGLAVTVSGLALKAGTVATNYTLAQPTGLTASITAATVSIASGLTANSKVYNGTTVATITSNNVVLNGVATGDVANVTLSTNGYRAVFGSANVTNGATVTVSGLTLTGSAATNYTLTQPTGLTANITPVAVTVVSGISANNKIYDGTTTATIASNNVVLSGVLAGDVAAVALSTNGYHASFGSASVANGATVTVSGLTLTGSAAGNYTLSQPTGLTANITSLTVTVVSGLTANNKVYNGTTTATLTSNAVVLSGVVAGDAANVALSTNGYTATFASPYVGTKNVSVQGLVLTGSAAGNYTLTQPTLSASITAAPLTLTGVTAANTNYNGTTVALLSGGSLSGVVNGDSVTFTTGTGSFASKYVGTWAVTASGYALATSGVATNYTLTAQPTVPNATITPAPLTFVSGITANSKVYDGTTTATITSNNVVLNGVVAGDTVYITTNGYSAAFASANMGTGLAVTVNGLALKAGTVATNYTLAQPTGLTASITAATVSIASGLTANSKVYDGTTVATILSNNVVLSGVATGDVANVTLSTNGYSAAFGSASVANGAAVTVSGLTLTGSAAANYTLTQPTGLTANITPLAVTVVSGITANDKIYDGSAAATLTATNVVLAGVLAADTANVSLSLKNYVAAFASANVGSNQPVTVSGLSLAGSAGGNYTVTQPTGLTASITAAPWSITYTNFSDPSATTGTIAWAIDGTNIVGNYTDAAGNHGFLDVGGVFTTLNDPSASSAGTSPRGISGNIVVGQYYAGVQTTTACGFTYNVATGVYTTLNDPLGTNGNYAMGIQGSNIVGYYNNATGSHGYLYNGGTFTTLDDPAANNITYPRAIYGSNIAGYYTDAAGLNHGFIYNTNTGVYTTLDDPQATRGTFVRGIWNNFVVGYYTDGLGNHGFLYNGSSFITLNNPGGPNSTYIYGISGATAVGFYSDATGNHAFTVTLTSALPPPAPTTTTVTAPVAVTYGTGVVWTASVAPVPASGTIQFLTNGIPAGVAQTLNAGTATFTNSLPSAGNILVSAAFSGNVLAAASTSDPVTQVVNPAPVTVTGGIKANDKVYDSTPAATLTFSNPTLGGVRPADAANVQLLTSSYVASFVGAGVGNSLAVSVSGLTLTGRAAANYTLLQPDSLTANITPAPVTVAGGVTANNKAYDSTRVATLSISNPVLNGVLAADVGAVSLVGSSYVATFATATPGIGIAVTVSGLSLGGAAAANYSLSQPTGLTANITQATVAITSPANNVVIITNNPTITLTGTTAGNAVLTAVRASLDGTTWTSATSANNYLNWTVTLPVGAGPQTALVYAQDAAGNAYATNSVHFTITHTSVIAVSTNGNGSVSPNLNGQTLKVGQSYSMVAIPAANWRFTNWTSNVLPTSSSAALNFTMASNLTLTANFAYAVNPLLTVTALTNKQVIVTNATTTTVKGVTSSKVAIAGVWVTVGTNDWMLADTTNNWYTWETVQPIGTGAQTMRAYALDIYGNNSGTNVINFDIQRTAYMTVITNGDGTIWHDWDNQYLEVGGVFTMTATGRNGWSFLNWTSNQEPAGQNLGTNLTLTFRMQTNLVITGNFVDLSQPLVILPFTSNGIHSETNQSPFVINGGTTNAADGSLVTNVWVSFNGGPWQTPVTTNNYTNWTLTVTPVLNSNNTVRAYAASAVGNLSPTNSTYFNYQQVLPVSVQTDQFGTGLGTISLTTNGQSLTVGTKYYIKAQPAAGCVFSNWTSNLLPPTNAETFTFTFVPNLTLYANFLDITRPTLTVKNGTDNQIVTNAAFTVLGTAADNCAVAQVRYSLNSNAWQVATGTTNWSFAATLTPGLNSLQVYSVDPAGNGSVTNLFHVFYQVPATLTVRTNGLGTIAGLTSPYYLGHSYTLTAVARPGFVFTNWTSNQGLNSKSAALTFNLTSNLVLTANFADTQAPVVTITTPATTRVTNSVFTLTGTASDNWGLGGVYCQVNGGAWQPASSVNGYTNWNITLGLVGSTNVINVRAADLGSPTPQYSPVKSVTIVLFSAPFNLQNLRAEITPDDGTPMFEINFAATTFAQYAWSTNVYDAAGSFTYTNSAPNQGVISLQATAFPANVFQQSVNLVFTNRYIARLNYTNGNGQLVGATAVFAGITNITPNALVGKTVRFVTAAGLPGSWSFGYHGLVVQTIGTQVVTNSWGYQSYGPCGALLTLTGAGQTNWCLFHYESAEAAEYYNAGTDGSEDLGLAGFDDGVTAAAPASLEGAQLLSNAGSTLTAVSFASGQFSLITSDDSLTGTGTYGYSLTTTNQAQLILDYTAPQNTSVTNQIRFYNPAFGVTTNGTNVLGVLLR